MVPAMISKDRGLKVDVEVGTILVLRWASKFPNATRDALARSTRKLIAERIVLSKQNVETVPAAFYLSATWPTRRSRVGLSHWPRTTSGELIKPRTLMRPVFSSARRCSQCPLRNDASDARGARGSLSMPVSAKSSGGLLADYRRVLDRLRPANHRPDRSEIIKQSFEHLTAGGLRLAPRYSKGELH